MLGMALLAPLIMVLQRPAFFSMLSATKLPGTLLVLAGPVAAAALVFTHNGDPVMFLLFPAFILVAFRLGFPGTVLAILLVTLMAIGFTIRGHGPLTLIPGAHMLLHRIVVAQVFGAVALFTMFPVAALLEDKDRLKVSLAASEERYRKLAHADELTGLANRRSFNLQLDAAWAQARAQNAPIALVLVDVDHFKQYNDVYGHLGGDDCLRVLARLIERVTASTNGHASRFGGEEFAIILPGTLAGEAVTLAEQIRAETMSLGLYHPTSACGLQTVSVGVACTVPQDEHDVRALVAQADEALYAAKLAGRNCVVCA